jgi:hypothetical protein
MTSAQLSNYAAYSRSSPASETHPLRPKPFAQADNLLPYDPSPPNPDRISQIKKKYEKYDRTPNKPHDYS